MKKILFLLLFTVSIYGQTYQNPTFGTITTKTAPLNTTSDFITTTSVEGVQGKILGENIPLSVIPPVSHFTPTAPNIKGYFQGVDDAIGNLPATTAGSTTRLWYTADQVTITAGTFYKTNFSGKGIVSSAVQSVTNNDDQKKYFTQDLIGDAYVTTTTFPKGVYAANLSASTSPSSANQRYTIEVYKCNTNGTPIASGVTGAVVGDLGVTVIGILDSSLITLADASITNIPLSTTIDYAFTINIGERVRYHISAEKVGTSGGNITESVYFGTLYNSYIDIAVPLNTSTIQNSSNVVGATATDALNNLKIAANAKESTGATISLDNVIGNYYNMYSANTATSYTTNNLILGGKAIVLIYAATKPVVAGAKETINNTFVANEKMYMTVWNNGNRVEYFFTTIANETILDLTVLPYGAIIVQSATPATVFIGSPSIIKTSTGRYIMSHDYYGTGYDYTVQGTTAVYYTDHPLEDNDWTKATDIVNMFWATVFEYGGNLYLLGTAKENGSITLSKSTNNGLTWSSAIVVLIKPTGSFDGWSTSANSIIFKDGYLVKAFEAVVTGEINAYRYNAALVFANLADLENPANWSYSPLVTFNATTFVNSGIYSNTTNVKLPPVAGTTTSSKGFLEGSIVQLSSGNLRLFMRLEQSPNSNHALYMDINWVTLNPTTSTINPTQNIVNLHGGNVRYQVIRDAVSNKLFTITNVNRFKYFSDNRLEAYLLSSSDNGVTWDILKKVSGYTATTAWQTQIPQYATQYASFIIEGNDILFSQRTSNASANDWHNANAITLSKITNFRDLTPIVYVDGAMIIDENSVRIEDANGISIIHDRTNNFNSPFMLSADNANKPNWATNGIQFNGTSDYLRIIHERTLSLANSTGMSIFVVIENLQSTTINFVLSNDNGVDQSNVATKGGWWFSPTGMGLEARYGDYNDLTLSNNYIIASSFDNVNSHIWNYKNGVNRGDPASKVGTTWSTDHLVMAGAYSGTNYKEVWIGRRNIGATKLYFNSKIRALHIVPRYMTPSEMVAYQTALNALYGIY